ncbi:hypothetical protein [Chryseobacterium lineare]
MNYELKQILKKQIISGAAPEHGSFDDYSERDLQVLVDFEKQILINNGYKKLKDKDFKLKINEIFGRQVDYTSDSKYVIADISGECKEEVVFEPFTSEKMYIYVSKENNFITFFLPLPNIVDYLRLYPELAEYESKPITKQTDNGKINILQWKDISALAEQRPINLQTLISRNKYLFNERRADFAWLKFNDKPFLESLVKTFGYVKDQELLKFVLENNNKSIEGFGEILWNEKCDGKVVFNKETVKLIQESSIEKQQQYIDKIADYLSYEIQNTTAVLKGNFSKKAEILGKIAYYGEKTGKKINKSFQCFKILLLDKERERYEEEFKTNNYYNISDFKEIWEEAKAGNGGVLLENGSSGRQTSPLRNDPDFSNEIIKEDEKSQLKKKKGFWNNLFR